MSCTLLLVTLSAGVTACSGDHPLAAEPYDAAEQLTFSAAPGGKRVAPDHPLRVSAAESSRITDVTAVDSRGRYVRGDLSADGRRWRSTVPLAARAEYTVRVSTEDDSGTPGRRTVTFRTTETKSKKRLRVKFGPGGGTYGVGQPLVATLSRAVKEPEERKIVERGLKVRSTPGVEGAWYWVDSKELHYRPRVYWPTGSTVTLRSTLEGVKIRNGLYATASKPQRLRIGDKVVAVTDAAAHRMTFYRNGKKVRSFPVTTGKPGFSTRNGKKVVLEKQQYVRMRGTSIGIAAGSAESYDLPVYWATRVTWSGEYVHAAPWSVGSQGSANVSHGCTGMSTANANWFFKNVRHGDIVEVVGSTGDKMAPFGNGFGDWNLSWQKWLQGSAVTGGTPSGDPADVNRLRPRI
jgi:lipoprotein-anchoring transpeptidase ErfK/SrfK